MTLNKELLLKTAEALESGKFPQARYTWGGGNFDPIHQKQGFCCLHVMIAVHTETTDREQDAISRIIQADDRYHGDSGGIFDRSLYVAGISGMSHPQISEFVSMNDGGHKTFPEIAAEMRKLATTEEATEA
jgi:hypothetical protein